MGQKVILIIVVTLFIMRSTCAKVKRVMYDGWGNKDIKRSNGDLLVQGRLSGAKKIKKCYMCA